MSRKKKTPADEVEPEANFLSKRKENQRRMAIASVGIAMTRTIKKTLRHHPIWAALFSLKLTFGRKFRSLCSSRGTAGLRFHASQCFEMNIEALCAAPPEALAHSPSQMPLSCPVAPHLISASCTKTAAAAVVASGEARKARGARAPKASSCTTS